VSALAEWGIWLRGWGIPEEILSRAPESPWGFPPDLMRRRGRRAASGEPSISTSRALEALPDGGTVLDVGVGGGAASLGLARRASLVIGVDSDSKMLEVFAEAGAAEGTATRGELGGWQEVASRVEPVDVVVCSHVLYNVPELEPFVLALDDHARRRVVIEITKTHPLAWMADLWQRFHGLERPLHPTADDAVETLRELGLEVRREDDHRPPRAGGFERREDAISLVRRRLCLAADRDEDIAEALGDRLAEREGLWSAGPTEQTVVTLWWDPPR
jgi:SAM-dependent methyltransferase